MKTAEEWSNAFDVFWNNIASNQAPGLSEYEKSLFLTKAQNELLKNWWEATSKGNSIGRGFDDSAIRQMDFSALITADEIKQSADTPKTDYRAVVYNMPPDLLIMVNEQLYLKKSDADSNPSVRQVIPINYREYIRLMSKPFKEPLKRQAWRLQINNTVNKAEIVMTSLDKEIPVKDYIVRYIRKPFPIILGDLTEEFGDDITIDNYHGNEDKNFACELDEGTHDMILQRAVELAKTVWEIDVNQITAMGQRGE